jgi:isopenicillin N synthase-like dioxygenase
MSLTRIKTLIQGSQKVNNQYYTYDTSFGINREFIKTCESAGLIKVIQYDFKIFNDTQKRTRDLVRHIFTLTDTSKRLLEFERL